MDIRYIRDNPDAVKDYIAQVRKENTDLWNETQDLEIDLEKVRAELAECRKDAERFVWLADRLQDISIDLAEPSAYIADDDDWVKAWRMAIDAACS